MKDEIKELNDKLNKEPMWCYKCNTSISVLVVDKRPTFVCLMCSETTDGYIKEERKLVLALQEHVSIPKYSINSIIYDVRKNNPLTGKLESLEKEIQAITSTFDAREEYIKKLEAKIEELENLNQKIQRELLDEQNNKRLQIYELKEEIKLMHCSDNILIKKIKELQKELKQLQAVREAAGELQKLYKELIQILEDDGNTLADIYYQTDKKLEQALAKGE